MKPALSSPWQDRTRRLSPMKLVVFLSLFVPGIWIASAYIFDMLGPRPLNEAIHQTGLWMIRFLFLSLTVTPARQLLGWPRLILVRRMIGVAAFTYGAAHLLLYSADQAFELAKIVSEIVLRFYLTIGFVALVGLATLAATSTDGMVRRLGGKRWQRLHRAVYFIAVLAAVHYFIQSKADVFEPMVMFGLYFWLMGYRLVGRGRGEAVWRPIAIAAVLSLAASVLTALGEAGYFWARVGVDPLRVLGADIMWSAGVRPAWFVLLVSMILVAAAALRALVKRAPGSPARKLAPAKAG